MPVNIQKYRKRLAVFAAALFLFLPCFQGMAQGAETMDPSRETALTVYFGHEGTGFSGVEFQLYRVAEMSETGAFSLTGSFAGYPVSLKGLDSSGWRALAQTLDAYIARDGLSPERTAVTGGDGLASFSGLSTGLYLVTGNRYEQGRYTYTPESFLVSLPGLSPEGEWSYTQAVAGKYGSTYDPPGGSGGGDDGGTVSRKVLKAWRGDEGESRPEEITVQLLRDGDVYDTVTLNQENNWRHTWTDLEKGGRWQVAEEETPEDYTVSVSQEGITFVMTNTYGPSTDIPEEPVPGGGLPPVEYIQEELVPMAMLPQTGVLWWPVPFLACGGLFLFLIGWGRGRHEESER